jgi:LPXTG-motif cell wall-anchored protein
MSFKGGEMILGRKGFGATLAVLAAAMLVLSGLFASPARAQALEEPLEDIVIDLVVDVEQGECGEGGCREDRRPVTFDARLEVNAASATALGLEPEDIEAVNEALAEVELTDDLIEIRVTDDEGRTRVVEDGDTVCLAPGQYEVETTLVDEAALETAVVAELVGLDPDPDLDVGDITIEEFDDTFVVEECPVDPDDGDDGDVIIDDRSQTNVCENVVNIILEDVQNPVVDNDQNANVTSNQSNTQTATGNNSNEQVVEVSQEQVVEIAQELNVSPVIVQQCIQQNAGRDAIIVIDDGGKRHDGGKHRGGKVFDEHSGAGVAGGSTDVILETIPDKRLPNTGGSPVVWAGIVALLALYAALFAWRVRRRGW